MSASTITSAASRPKVSSVAIELTAHCNQKCTYCYNEWREDGGAAVGAPRAETVFARVDRLLDAVDIERVTLTGGEPFAHHDVFGLLERLHARGIPVQMISNGGLIDDDVARRLRPFKLGHIQVALNGPNAKLHEEHVGEGHFDKTIVGIQALRRHGIAVTGCIVVTKVNAHRVGEILELWHSLGVRNIALSRFSPAGYAASHAARLLCTRDELTVSFEQALPFARDRGMRIDVTMPVPPCAVEVERFAPIRFGVCPIGTSAQEFALGPDGKLRNCTLHSTAIGGVADILDPSVDIAALLKAPEITQYRKRVPEFCRGCLHESSCGGGCGAAAEWISVKGRTLPDPFVWQHIDDTFAAELNSARAPKSVAKPKRRLEVVL